MTWLLFVQNKHAKIIYEVKHVVNVRACKSSNNIYTNFIGTSYMGQINVAIIINN